MRSSICILASLFLLALTLQAAETPTTPEATTPRPYPERLQWWADGRFGLFIHWGPVSLRGTEISWSRANTNPECPNSGVIPADVYDNLYKDFNPTHFDAPEWVSIAKAAGAKYIVLTAKHCDGFLLWHSQASDYNISRTPFRRDICAELAAGGAGAGHADRLVLFADGLAGSGFSHSTQCGVPGPDAGGSARTAGQLRPALTCCGSTGTGTNRCMTSRRTYQHRENACSRGSSSTTGSTWAPATTTARSCRPTQTITRPSSMSARMTTSDRGNRA